jgi:hypothetical protein
MKGPHYRMTPAGTYAYYVDDVFQFETDRVAIAFCKDTGGMLRHGRPEIIEPMFLDLCDAYNELGMAEEVTYLEYIEGRFDLEDLNRAIAESHNAGQLFFKLGEQARKPATRPSMG